MIKMNKEDLKLKLDKYIFGLFYTAIFLATAVLVLLTLNHNPTLTDDNDSSTTQFVVTAVILNCLMHYSMNYVFHLKPARDDHYSDEDQINHNLPMPGHIKPELSFLFLLTVISMISSIHMSVNDSDHNMVEQKVFSPLQKFNFFFEKYQISSTKFTENEPN